MLFKGNYYCNYNLTYKNKKVNNKTSATLLLSRLYLLLKYQFRDTLNIKAHETSNWDKKFCFY